jgi:hypothetical protein
MLIAVSRPFKEITHLGHRKGSREKREEREDTETAGTAILHMPARIFGAG